MALIGPSSLCSYFSSYHYPIPIPTPLFLYTVPPSPAHYRSRTTLLSLSFPCVLVSARPLLHFTSVASIPLPSTSPSAFYYRLLRPLSPPLPFLHQ
ncbi:hypothetical protein BHE74_00039419 [Ensete ventricosum]|nr:hypothetical protein BHE74_00039419 [Ensete ventricosum]RZR95825.1 hypothetical protein BHM03_00024715 [Ensete ventricosum]